jgi:hypothetical protein
MKQIQITATVVQATKQGNLWRVELLVGDYTITDWWTDAEAKKHGVYR